MQISHSPFIVTGMHRSGTSLLAGLLHESHVNMGAQMLGAADSNPKGHYEDIQFLNFHRSVLLDSNLSPFGWTCENSIRFSEDRVKEARHLVLEKQKSDFWGWKDPRTTLVLDFWASIFPTAKFLFAYRSVAEVADSLFRRAAPCDDVFFHQPKMAILFWIHYNKKLIEFFDSHFDQCILVESSQLARNPNVFLAKVEDKFGLRFPTRPSNFSDPGLLQRDFQLSNIPQLLVDEFSGLAELEEKLAARATKLDKPQVELADSNEQFKSQELQSWIELRKREKRLKKLETEMNHVCGVLGDTLEDVKTIFKRLDAQETPTNSLDSRLRENEK